MGEHGISVVIPLYNKRDTIEEVLYSVLNQSSLPDELIVVDDVSTDGSFEVAKAFQFRHGNQLTLTLIRNRSRSGPSVSRNRGIDRARSSYIYFLDADDLLFKDAIFDLRYTIARYTPDIIFTKAFHRSVGRLHPSVDIGKFAQRTESKIYRIIDPIVLFEKEFPFIGCNFAVKKSPYLRFDPTQYQFEDCQFIYDYVTHYQFFLYLDKISILYNLKNKIGYSAELVHLESPSEVPSVFYSAIQDKHFCLGRRIMALWMSYIASRASSRSIILEILRKNWKAIVTGAGLSPRFFSPFIRVIIPDAIFFRLLSIRKSNKRFSQIF